MEGWFRVRDAPDVFVLERVSWQFFVSLTFRGVVPSIVGQDRMLFAWLRGAARRLGVHFHHLLWVSRRERGETFGREHFHLLIGGAPITRCNRTSVWALKNSWERFGMARVASWDGRSNAIGYLLKPESFWDGSKAYETSKFDTRIADLMVAHAVIQKWERRRDLHAA
jgi:hypothetical protein